MVPYLLQIFMLEVRRLKVAALIGIMHHGVQILDYACHVAHTGHCIKMQLFNAKERATQTSWNSNSTIDNTQEMDPTPSMSWDHLTPDPSPVLGAPDESLENQEDFSQILNDTTQLVGNSSKVFEDTPQKCCTSLQCRVNTSKGTVNSSCSRNVSSQTEPDYSHTPQTSFRRNSTQIQPSISELRDMTSEVSPMVRGSPFIFVDSSIRVDSPQFVVDSTQLRVESPYHITDTPLSPFTDTKSYGTTSIALRLAHSPLGKNLPLYSPGSSRKSSSSTVSQNESPKKEFSNYCHHNSRNHRLHSPAYILLEDPEPSRITEANKQISQNYQQNNNDLHLDSKIPQRLSPTATHYLQITSPKDVSQNLHIATINNVPSKEIQTSSQTSGNNSCCITQQCEGESSPEVITAEAESSPRVITTDTLETLVTDDDI
ncbi:unnamed protein product [Meganyctiphanes norvegica]|uniref:Uncharacterized protein n=1 Tax=Meganyctiphanes norvegica TaxID=48144 RepID=A0AAV2PMJ1_MEGNR